MISSLPVLWPASSWAAAKWSYPKRESPALWVLQLGPHLPGHVLSVTGHCWYPRPVLWILGASQGKSSVWGYSQVADVGLM